MFQSAQAGILEEGDKLFLAREKKSGVPYGFLR